MVAQLNHTIVAARDKHDRCMKIVDRLDLDTYQPYHATRADLLRRLGRKPEAAAAYQAAIALSSNDTERAYLTGRLRTLS